MLQNASKLIHSHRTIKLNLQSSLPDYPTLDLFDFPSLQLYPPPPALRADAGATELQPGQRQGQASRHPFPASQTFNIPLPPRIPLPSWAQQGEHGGQARLPGTLNLAAYNKGQIRYALTVLLVLASGQVVSHSIPVEGTPQLVPSDGNDSPARGDGKEEVEEVLRKRGVMTRLVLSTARPRLGRLLHLGVEIRREGSESGDGEKGIAEGEEEETRAALRRMRRVTVELFRRVIIHPPPSATNTDTITHQTLLHASGKSLRYPGPSRANPPLRLLFTIPTIPNPSSSTTTTHNGTGEQSWGEVSMVGGYHQVTFGLRVGVGGGVMGGGIGLGVGGAAGRAEGGGCDENDFVVEKEIEILPKIWSPLAPRPAPAPAPPPTHQTQYQLQTQDGVEFDIPHELAAELALVDSSSPPSAYPSFDPAATDTLSAREAYRLKGRDIVGPSGTTRLPPSSSGNADRGGDGGEGQGEREDDLPPPFESSTVDSTSLGRGPSEEYSEEYFLSPPVDLGEEPVPYDDHHHHHHQPGTSTAVSTTHRADPQPHAQEPDQVQRDDQGEGQGSGLPTFLESEQQEERRARARAASQSDAFAFALRGARGKEREASAGRGVGTGASARTDEGAGEGAESRGRDGAAVQEKGQGQAEEGETGGWSDDGEMGVGREGLGGELATWIEVCQPPFFPSLSEAKQLTHSRFNWYSTTAMKHSPNHPLRSPHLSTPEAVWTLPKKGNNPWLWPAEL